MIFGCGKTDYAYMVWRIVAQFLQFDAAAFSHATKRFPDELLICAAKQGQPPQVIPPRKSNGATQDKALKFYDCLNEVRTSH